MARKTIHHECYAKQIHRAKTFETRGGGGIECGSTVPTVPGGGGGEALKKGAEEGTSAKNDTSEQPAAAGSSVYT